MSICPYCGENHSLHEEDCRTLKIEGWAKIVVPVIGTIIALLLFGFLG